MPERADANPNNRMATMVTRRSLLRMCAANETVQAAVILALLVNMFFFPFIWGNKTLLESARGVASITQFGATGDAPAPKWARSFDPWAPAWFLEPLAEVVGRVYVKEKTVPLWNPYAGFGVPLAAAMQPQTFHPLAFLLSLDPTPTAFSLFFITRLWIAGFFTYLFLRLFIEHLGALAGAIAFMFTGYFILYLNMFHLTVEMMLPTLFLAFELLHRRFDSCTIVLASATILLAIIGGAPESTFLIVIFACCFYVLRSITKTTTTASATKLLVRLVVVNVIGFGMASFLLLPFLEYVTRSFTLHTGNFMQGLGPPVSLRSLLSYIAPLVAGPPSQGLTFSLGVPNKGGYFGVGVTILATLAVVGLVAERNKRQSDPVTFLVTFFSVSAAIMIMKRYSIPLVQWIGYLPVFRRVGLNKYLEPLTGFCIAILCGVGFSHVLAHRCRRAHVVFAIGIILTALMVGYAILPHESVAVQTGICLAAAVLVAVGAILAMSAANGKNSSNGKLRSASFSSILLLTVTTGELFLMFIYPMFYRPNRQPDKSVNPFFGAPYISWLQQKDTKTFRVLARESFLYPNWAGVFQIFDVRALDALYPEKYLPFVRAFFDESAKGADAIDLRDRFTGDGPYYSFVSPKARRFLQLSSVQYLITKTPFAENSLVAPFLETGGFINASAEEPLGETDWTIGGVTKHVLVQPLLSPKIAKTKIEPWRTELVFSLGTEPKEYGCACGDGVDFMIDVREANGSVKRVFHSMINPCRNLGNRHWFDERVDLAAYSGQLIEILLSTASVPPVSRCAGLAGWGDIKFAKPFFNLVYDKDVRIYEYSSILPRAAIFYQAEMAATDEEALKRLTDPELNIFQRVVITPSSMNPETGPRIEEMNAAPPRDAAPARIVRLESREIDVDATLDRPGILVLNDTNYPGWKVYVDGKEESILSANYLFRGVLLESGHHLVAFRYVPLSFRLGVVISFLSAIGLLFAVLFPDRLGLS